MSNLRIIAIGASGVGKTTLVESLTPLLALNTIPELARELCKEMGYERIGNIPDQEGFKQAVLTKQIEREEELESFISDRSTIDCWVLWQRWNICQAMTYDSEAFYNKAKAQAEKYSHIIYIPPMFPPQDDGFRWTDSDYQKQIDRLVKMTLYDWNLLDRVYEVKSDNPKDRVKETENWISQNK